MESSWRRGVIDLGVNNGFVSLAARVLSQPTLIVCRSDERLGYRGFVITEGSGNSPYTPPTYVGPTPPNLSFPFHFAVFPDSHV